MRKEFFGKGARSGNFLTQLTTEIHDAVLSNVPPSSAVAKAAISTEHIDDMAIQSLNTAAANTRVALEGILQNLGVQIGIDYKAMAKDPQISMENRYADHQINAGVIAGIICGDIAGFLGRKPAQEDFKTGATSFIPRDTAERLVTLEAYDERSVSSAAAFSIVYNMQASRQDEFGETLFPTITISPDTNGITINAKLMTVFNGVTRDVSGTFEDFNRKNIIRAIADPTILHKDQTKIIPVVRAQAADKFVSNSVIAARTVVLEGGESIETAPLAIGKKVDLLAISQTDELLAAGAMDHTDSIDPNVILQNIYVTFSGTVGGNPTTDVLKFNTLGLPLANFVASYQDNYMKMVLNFATTSILINKDTKQMDGSALSVLAGIVSNDYRVRLEVRMSGDINVETGQCNVYANLISVAILRDADDAELDITVNASPQKAVADLVNAGVIVGYDLQAYRANMNRRQRGQLINVTETKQVYNLNLRSPIAIQHPITMDASGDSSDINALITATRIRITNEAVGALVSVDEMLAEYIDIRDQANVGPDVLGIGRYYVKPYYNKESIDMNNIVDSIKSADRARDMQEALVTKLRDHAYRMYRDSEYKAAADALHGGVAPVPTVIIATDPVISRYLNVTGDLRTLGPDFNVRIVSTLDFRVAGHIFMTFGMFDESRNTEPHPLNFGNMLWSPELVLTAQINRNGATNKETVVQPRYLFINNLPILVKLTITNIPDLTNKAILKFKSV